MTPADTQKFEALLRNKHDELASALRKRNDIAIEKTPDGIDEVQLMGERELAIRSLDRNSAALRQITRALARIEGGTYGICLHCEEAISPKRIAAVPWTAFCLSCQDKIDRSEIEISGIDSMKSPMALKQLV
ncbi:MAG TPA: TraR/DksA family transcriptional regulator [Bryobacteraceae bacterium]|nr:TraR/DksA family transcriptional regulator [Bryobacteraceae bacterium]